MGWQVSASTDSLEIRFLASLEEIPAERWNALTGVDYPFLRHEFLQLLEQTGCCDEASGWQPCHATLYRDGELIALMPLYLKTHSYGEYVFDWSWADAWSRSGLNYYPKLVTAAPFTPATGPRLCLAAGESAEVVYPWLLQAIRQFADENKISSWHVLFPSEEEGELLRRAGTSLRIGSQFHWFNQGYSTFDDFLATFNSRKRKSLKRERRTVGEQGIELRILEGDEISDADWQRFYRFYQMTYAKRSGHGGYLSREFFLGLGKAIPEHCVMALAYQNDEAVAGALYFRSSDTLYGRYWGCEQELDCLHFEACYYQGIDYCIRKGLQRFDPGAQGEHKIQRGFTPIKTCSNHWIADEQLRAAIEDFTAREQPGVEAYIASASDYLPFKQSNSPD
jgi:uncharacterized protein